MSRMSASTSDLFVRFLNNLVFALYPFVYIPFLFPFNCLYEYFTMYNPDCFREQNSPKVHNQKVQKIQEQVRAWNRRGRKNRMCSARSTSKTLAIRNIDKRNFTQIQLDEMQDIIELDLNNMTIRVEPGISMGTLTHKLLPLGVIIPVIPEFETLTVGGVINGAGLETSSHKYGLFAATCLEYEVVLSDGSVITCSQNENSELFYAMPMAYGTLGFMTSVTFPLIKAAKYVKLEYHVAKSMSQAQALMSQTENEFIEGIAYSKDESVIMLGNFSHTAQKGKVNNINRWYKNWFYKHVETFLDKDEVVVEYIPTRDYYHRHTRSYFWTMTTADITQWRPFIFLFGWSFPPNFSFIKTILPFPKVVIDWAFTRNVLQDFVIPMDKLKESVEMSDRLTGIYPLWFCPCKMFKRPGLVRCRGDGDMNYVDIGIYGSVGREKRDALGGNINKAVKLFEQFTIKNTGFQGMYTDCFLSPQDFDKMFDRTLYEQLRTKLNCADAFPDVYQKISINFKRN